MHYIYTGHIQTFLPHVIISQTKQYLYLPRIYIILDVLSNPKVIQCIEKDCVSYIQILYCFTEELPHLILEPIPHIYPGTTLQFPFSMVSLSSFNYIN